MLNIIVGVVLLATSSSQSTQAIAAQKSTDAEVAIERVAPASADVIQATLSPKVPFQIRKAYVGAYYADTPVLARIAFCESTYRQVNEDGSVRQGLVNKGDVGVMQINVYYHGERAKALGYDLSTAEGNLGYARYLYEREGTAPWNSSKSCWEGAANEADAQADGLASR